MKKVPSYPKITTKTNITFTQTQNININSPKGLAFSTNGLSAKKMFKSNNINSLNSLNSNVDKFSRQRQKSNNSYVNTKKQKSTNEKSKSKILTQKGSKSTAELLMKKQNSSGNLKLSKNLQGQGQIKAQQKKTGGKQEIKVLEQKLKLLQKKIDTMKTSTSKRKKESSQSHRSRSKVKQNTNSSTNITHYSKQSVQQFQKKKPSTGDAASVNKILKKSYSDKNILKSRPPKMPYKLNRLYEEAQQGLQNQQPQQQIHHKKQTKAVYSKKPISPKVQEQQQEVIHKFVTQVQKNPKMVQKHNHLGPFLPKSSQKIHYYITNLNLSIHNADYMIYREHLIQSLHILSYLKTVRKPSLKQLEKHSVTIPNNTKHKYTLVLDLDETLIHCNESIDLPHDVSLKIKFPTGQKIDAGINIRPHAIKLLRQLSQICEIIVFTAILDHLDPHKKYIAHRLYRNHCWPTEGGIYIKDLRILKKRDLQNVLLVDNAAYSYFYQLQNGIPIIPFYDDKQDDELLHLMVYIKSLMRMKQNHKVHNTFKKANQNYFKLTQYIKFNDLQKLTTCLYTQNLLKQLEQFSIEQNDHK